jgi:DNA-binding beta-propeller fold protein YncE
MRPRHALAAGLAATALTAATVAVGATATAVDPPYTPLPITTFTELATDPHTGNVYVSSAEDDTVVVADRDRALVGTIPDLDGASGLAVSGDTLYVALKDAAAIAAIDTATLRERARYATGAAAQCPTYLAAAAGTVWFGYGCTFGGPAAGLGRLRVVDGVGTVELNLQDGAGLHTAPRIAAASDPAGPLAVAVPGLSPATAYIYDVVDGRPELRITSPWHTIGESLSQLALTPDGSQVLVVCGFPYQAQVFSTTDFQRVTGYSAGDGRVGSAALTPDARHVAVGGGSATLREPDVFVYAAGQATPLRRYDFGQEGGSRAPNELARRGLAWSGDGTRLFAVTVDSVYGENPALRVLNPLP